MNGRCPHCGSRTPTWTPDSIVAACQEWAAKYGDPPKAQQWRASSPLHPSNSTVRVVFGTWNAMIRAAGFKPRPAHGPFGQWTKPQIEQLIYEFTHKHGRTPTCRDWQRTAHWRPTSHCIIRIYGSWNGALVAAGYPPRGKGGRRRSVSTYQHIAGAATRAAA